jgi:hypothetical protein
VVYLLRDDLRGKAIRSPITTCRWTFLATGVKAMTEEEWLGCTNPHQMLTFLGEKATERKWRLFAAACCRRVWAALEEASRDYVLLAERVADGGGQTRGS